MGRGRGPDADRLTYRVMGRGARVGGEGSRDPGGRRSRERQRDSARGETKSETARHADLERPVGRETRGTKVLEEESQPLTPSLPSVLLVPQTSP